MNVLLVLTLLLLGSWGQIVVVLAAESLLHRVLVLGCSTSDFAVVHTR